MATNDIKSLVTATATNTGGRNGHSETTDHSVSVNLSVRAVDCEIFCVPFVSGRGIVKPARMLCALRI